MTTLRPLEVQIADLEQEARRLRAESQWVRAERIEASLRSKRHALALSLTAPAAPAETTDAPVSVQAEDWSKGHKIPARPSAEENAERDAEACMEHSADVSETDLRATWNYTEAELQDTFGGDYRGPDTTRTAPAAPEWTCDYCAAGEVHPKGADAHQAAPVQLTPEVLLRLPPGSVIRMTTRMKKGIRVETAYLTWREVRTPGEVYFGYNPCPLPDSVQCSWGCASLYASPRPYGLQSVEVVHVAV